MIDGSLRFPFFKRDEDGDIIGLDSNNAWHDEGQGVLMIENYYEKLKF